MAKARKTRKKISGTRRKVTKYQKLQKAVSKNCKNPTAANKKAVAKAKQDYVDDAVKKGKTIREAEKVARKADTCTPIRKRKK
ncbi:hypothetical protein [Aureispira sp. CCB-QB1]|uniref:hypothetical protein n=1 Tax=Aureispira sp. CCB-QB1 TaxID=1313421 RepID=UPI000698B523|nr:hypothetical protein [Aureispira sp. CCB-QB1]